MDLKEAERLVRRHRDAGVLLDAQLLLLLLVGAFNHSLIQRFKRTRTGTPGEDAEADFALICELLVPLAPRPRLWVTPHILTEVDNLAKGLQPKEEKEDFRHWLRESVLKGHSLFREHSVRSADAAAESGFLRLGLADCSVIRVARRRRLVVTCDFDLYRELEAQQLPVLYFNHLRFHRLGLDKVVETFFPSGRSQGRTPRA